MCDLPLGGCGICLEDHIVRDIQPVRLKGGIMAVLKNKKKGAPEPELLEGEVPDYTDLKLGDDFHALVTERAKLAERKKRIEEREAEIKEQLNETMEGLKKYPSVNVPDVSFKIGDEVFKRTYRVIRSEGATRKTLNPKLLLKNGVSAEIILKSTEETQGAPYVTVKEVSSK